MMLIINTGINDDAENKFQNKHTTLELEVC